MDNNKKKKMLSKRLYPNYII